MDITVVENLDNTLELVISTDTAGFCVYLDTSDETIYDFVDIVRAIFKARGISEQEGLFRIVSQLITDPQAKAEFLEKYLKY